MEYNIVGIKKTVGVGGGKVNEYVLSLGNRVLFILLRFIMIITTYEGCSKSFANRYTENTQSIGI